MVHTNTLSDLTDNLWTNVTAVIVILNESPIDM